MVTELARTKSILVVRHRRDFDLDIVLVPPVVELYDIEIKLELPKIVDYDILISCIRELDFEVPKLRKAESPTSFSLTTKSKVSEKYRNLGNITTSLATQVDISELVGLPIGFVEEVKSKPQKEVLPLPVVSKFSTLEGLDVEKIVNTFLPVAKIYYKDGSILLTSKLDSLSGEIEKIEFTAFPTRKISNFKLEIDSDVEFDLKFGNLLSSKVKDSSFTFVLLPGLHRVVLRNLEGKSVSSLSISLNSSSDLESITNTTSLIIGSNLQEEFESSPLFPSLLKSDRLNFILFSLTSNNIEEAQTILSTISEKLSYTYSVEDLNSLTSGTFVEDGIKVTQPFEVTFDRPEQNLKRLRIIIDRESFLNLGEDRILRLAIKDTKGNLVKVRVEPKQGIEKVFYINKVVNLQLNSNIIELLFTDLPTPIEKVSFEDINEDRPLTFQMISFEKEANGIYFIGKGGVKLKSITSIEEGLDKEEVAHLKRLPENLKSTLYSLSYLFYFENGLVIKMLNEDRILVSL